MYHLKGDGLRADQPRPLARSMSVARSMAMTPAWHLSKSSSSIANMAVDASTRPSFMVAQLALGSSSSLEDAARHVRLVVVAGLGLQVGNVFQVSNSTINR
jgi:hypothetical protein